MLDSSSRASITQTERLVEDVLSFLKNIEQHTHTLNENNEISQVSGSGPWCHTVTDCHTTRVEMSRSVVASIDQKE